MFTAKSELGIILPLYNLPQRCINNKITKIFSYLGEVFGGLFRLNLYRNILIKEGAMDTLSRRPKIKKTPQQQVVYDYRFDKIDSEEMLELFPLPRYFQIHFNHVHENCEQAKRQIDDLRQKLDRIEQKLDRFLESQNPERP